MTIELVPNRTSINPTGEWLTVLYAGPVFLRDVPIRDPDERNRCMASILEGARQYHGVGGGTSIDDDDRIVVDFDYGYSLIIENLTELRIYVPASTQEDEEFGVFPWLHAKYPDFSSNFMDRSVGFPDLLREQIRSVVDSLVDSIYRGLDLAIEEERAYVYARPQSPLAPFARILPDQWRYYFAQFDFGTDIAHGPGGEKLYSTRIEPRWDETPNSEGRIAKGGCLELLEQMMRLRPKERLLSQHDCQAWAKTDYGISGRKFAMIWESARARVPHASGWGPGRSSSGISETQAIPALPPEITDIIKRFRHRSRLDRRN
jgi:hypothetical protein